MKTNERRIYIRFLESVIGRDRCSAFYHLGRLDALGVRAPYASFNNIDSEVNDELLGELSRHRSICHHATDGSCD